jgi:uncharacterized membrane protein YqiK
VTTGQFGLLLFAVAVIVGIVVAVVRERRRMRQARELAAFVRRESLAARRTGEPTDGSQTFPSLATPPRPRPIADDPRR